MSNLVNERVIEEALELAAELDEIEPQGHVPTVREYIKDDDLQSVYEWLRKHQSDLKAYNEVAHDGYR